MYVLPFMSKDTSILGFTKSAQIYGMLGASVPRPEVLMVG